MELIYSSFGFIVPIAIGFLAFIWQAYSLVNKIKPASQKLVVELARRHELIPRLVEMATGPLGSAPELQDVVTANNIAGTLANSSLVRRVEAENHLSEKLQALLSILDTNPELRANQNFVILRQELVGIETRIQATRELYNQTVKELNISTRTFPGSMIASFINIEPVETFDHTSTFAPTPQQPVYPTMPVQQVPGVYAQPVVYIQQGPGMPLQQVPVGQMPVQQPIQPQTPPQTN